VGLGAGTVAAALGVEAAEAAVPGVLVGRVVRAAALTAAGKGVAAVVSSEAAALAEGVLRAMFYAKMKAGAAVVLAVTLMSGGGALTYRTIAGEPAAAANPTAPEAQAGPAAPTEVEKLRQMLAQKQRELDELRARHADDEQELARRDARIRQLEQTLSEKRSVDVDWGFPVTNTESARGVQRTQAQAQARDEVELLQAQLETKRAQLKATHLSLESARVTRPGDSVAEINKNQKEVADLTGQAEVRAAEVKEAEVRLAQAKRRLAALSPAEPAPDTHRRQWEQRASELEKRLEALRKEMEALRGEMKKQSPNRP
jgi:hypothetical protein